MAASEAFLKAVSEALSGEKFGIKGCVESSEGGVVFTGGDGSQRLVPPKEMQRIVSAFGAARDEGARDALVERASASSARRVGPFLSFFRKPRARVLVVGARAARTSEARRTCRRRGTRPRRGSTRSSGP